MKGRLSAPQGRTLQSAIDAFTINFKDPINAPAAEYALPVDPDGSISCSYYDVMLTNV